MNRIKKLEDCASNIVQQHKEWWPDDTKMTGKKEIRRSHHLGSFQILWSQSFDTSVGHSTVLNFVQAGEKMHLKMSSSNWDPCGVLDNCPDVDMDVTGIPDEKLTEIVRSFCEADKIEKTYPAVILAPLGYCLPAKEELGTQKTLPSVAASTVAQRVYGPAREIGG